MSRLLGVLALAGMLCFGIGMTGCTKKTSKKIVPGSGTTITGPSEKTVISSPEGTTKKKGGSTDMGPELEPKGGTTIKQTPSGGTTIKKGTAGSTTTKSSALIPQRDAQFTYGVPCAVNPVLPLLNRGVILRDGLDS